MNNFRILSISSAFSMLVASSGQAQITVQFNQPFTSGGGVSEGFADADGNVSNGLVYGILIDSAMDGFRSLYDSGFTLSAGNQVGLTSVGDMTDDTLWISIDGGDPNLTFSTGGLREDFANEIVGGDGGLGTIVVPNEFASLPFAILWFDDTQALDASVDDGVDFGLLEDGSFVLGGAGAIVNFGSFFQGEDDPRAADFGVFQTIPEPSAVMLSLLGGLALLRRRRA